MIKRIKTMLRIKFTRSKNRAQKTGRYYFFQIVVGYLQTDKKGRVMSYIMLFRQFR